MDKKTVPPKAAILGYAGVIPFAATAALVARDTTGMRQLALDGFLIYAAVILSFLGGIRWGAAISKSAGSTRGLIISVLPSLWAAFFLFWPSDHISAWGFMAGFLMMGLADWLHPGQNIPSWMRPLRMRLTLAVVACHLVVITVL